MPFSSDCSCTALAASSWSSDATGSAFYACRILREDRRARHCHGVQSAQNMLPRVSNWDMMLRMVAQRTAGEHVQSRFLIEGAKVTDGKGNEHGKGAIAKLEQPSSLVGIMRDRLSVASRPRAPRGRGRRPDRP